MYELNENVLCRLLLRSEFSAWRLTNVASVTTICSYDIFLSDPSRGFSVSPLDPIHRDKAATEGRKNYINCLFSFASFQFNDDAMERK